MRGNSRKWLALAFTFPFLGSCSLQLARAQGPSREPLANALTEAQWNQLDASVDRGLEWLLAKQGNQGEFYSARPAGQPGITALALLAFMSRGHQPGTGPYGKQLQRAVEFVLSCQLEDGLFSYKRPEAVHVRRRPSHTATYNHAIAGVMLSEAYGMNPERRDERLRSAIERAIARTRQLQTKRKPRPQDVGGWRYIRRSTEGADFESDLSVTAWHLMFYRSALNAGFEVRQEFAEEAVAYVRRCHVPLGDRNRRRGAFSYFAEGTHMANHPMTGCGLLTLALGGAADDPLCQDAADWLLAHPSRRYDDLERFSYAAYYSSQAMAQMGGHYWKEYYPSLAMGIVRGQQRDGSWLSQHDTTADFGPCYPTSMSILALTTGYQLLPIYQR